MKGVLLLVVTALALSTPAVAQDHLLCFKVHDPLLLSGTVDLDSPQFGAEPGCKIARATPPLFCVPATKTVVEARDRATGQPITPLPISGPNPGDRLCYKIKCDAPAPSDIEVTDQFGTRTLSGLRAKLLCTPAVKGGPTTTTTTTTTSTTTTICPASATVISGLEGCWYLGALGQSCDQACAGHTLNYSDLTRTVTGSDGTTAACTAALTALSAPPPDHCDGSLLPASASEGSGTTGVGCIYTDYLVFDPTLCDVFQDAVRHQWSRVFDPTTDSSSMIGWYGRVCACQP